MKLTLLFATLGALLVSGLPHDLDETLTTTNTLTTSVYPQIVGGYQARRGGAETNGERMRRGLKINSRPRTLHESAEAKGDLVKRIDNPPAYAPIPSGTAAFIYTFKGCYDRGSFDYGVDSSSPFKPYTTAEQLANDCSLEQDTLNNIPGNYNGFLISDDQTAYYDCEISIRISADIVAVPCIPGTFAYYSL